MVLIDRNLLTDVRLCFSISYSVQNGVFGNKNYFFLYFFWVGQLPPGGAKGKSERDVPGD